MEKENQSLKEESVDNTTVPGSMAPLESELAVDSKAQGLEDEQDGAVDGELSKLNFLQDLRIWRKDLAFFLKNFMGTVWRKNRKSFEANVQVIEKVHELLKQSL